jgi:hypothetical protein
VPAAAQLLNVLFRPEVLQALMAMALGSAGNREMPVAGTLVPLGAFTNLIGSLANLASADYNDIAGSFGAELPAYLIQVDGCLKCDASVPEERAGVLLDMLQTEAVSEEDEDMADVDEWWGELLFENGFSDEMGELGVDTDEESLDECECGEAIW